MAMTKVKALQMWCKKMCEGYRDVEVRDMAASWKSGLAFCAIIHRFRPDLIDYDSLSKENVFDNNQLAFEVAERDLQIPAFLEAADMVAIRVPDKLSVVTYVSQYYNYFHNKPQLGGPGVNKFVTPSKRKDNKSGAGRAEDKSLTPAQNKGDNTEIKRDRQESMGDKCSICHEKVYLMERQIENARLYHRRCFRNSELSPTSKVLKRQPYTQIEEKPEAQSTKYRKINNDRKLDMSKQTQSKSDVLKKDSEVKSVAGKDVPKGDQKFNIDSKVAMGVSDVPSWKVAESNKVSEKGLAFPKDDYKDRFGGAVSKAPETKSTSGNLVNKFKELDERNLKNLEANEAATNISNNKALEKTGSKTSNVGEPVKSHPVPKPRHNLGKTFEKMDTSEKPTPAARNQKTESPFTVSATSAPKDIKITTNSPPVLRKTDFLRPKSPTSQTSELSLNLTKHKSVFSKDESPSSPPPLPPSTPPKLPASQPPSISSNLPSTQPSKLDFNKSPVSSPRQAIKSSAISPKTKHKFDKAEPQSSAEPFCAPLKPPRVQESSKDERSSSPMDTSAVPVPSQAIVHEPCAPPSAVLVVPNRHNPQEEQKNREVLGGLLKTLANVRQKHDVQPDNVKAAVDDKPIGAKNPEFQVELRRKDNGTVDKLGDKALKPRPKTSFVSQKQDLFSNSGNRADESHGRTKMVTTTKTVITTTKTTTNKERSNHKETVNDVSKVSSQTKEAVNTDSDIPEWKRKLEEKKRARAKSAELVNDKSKDDSGPMLDWQKEAAKRKEARKGAYIDPEKEKFQDRNTNSSEDTSKLSQPLSPPQRKSLDILDKDRPISPPQRKSLDILNKDSHKTSNGYKEELKTNRFSVANPDKPTAKVEGNLKPAEQVKKKISYGGEPSTEQSKSTEEASKKKIGLAQKFEFESVELKPVAGSNKPARPVAPTRSPPSPRVPPPRPQPPKTSPVPVTKHHIPMYQIQQQLRKIDEKLTQLELKGRSLEDSIRNATSEEEDELMISWFELVNDKNSLVRKESDLVYISREQELEIEQDRIEQQLRNLVDKPDHLKTEEERQEQTFLLEKKVELVYQRNNIVDSIDDDRLRYLAEDADIAEMLQKKGFLKDSKGGKVHKRTGKKVK